MKRPFTQCRKSVLSLSLVLCGIGVLLVSCRRPDYIPTVPEIKAKAVPVVDTGYLTPTPIGDPVSGHPWIAHVNAVDLDHDGLMDVIACEAQEGKVLWLRQVSRGKYEEIVLADHLPAPVHAEVAEMNVPGRYDILVSCMSVVFPDNDKIGSIVILENDGKQHFTPHVVLEKVARVTDVRAGDFGGDGRIDLIVAQYGYDQGEIRFMERVGRWEFKSKILLDLPGTINVLVADFCGHGRQDIVALVSQQYEEIFLFENKGGASLRKGFSGARPTKTTPQAISACAI